MSKGLEIYTIYFAGVWSVCNREITQPKDYDWSMTFAHDDKNPYGAYAFSNLLPTLFPDQNIAHSYKTFYEFKDSLTDADNIIVICSNFSADKEDTKTLLQHVEKGGSVFISAQYFWGHFSDTLSLETYDYFFRSGNIFGKRDTSFLKFANTRLDTVAGISLQTR